MAIYRYGVFEKGSFFEEIKTFPCTTKGRIDMLEIVEELKKENTVIKRN